MSVAAAEETPADAGTKSIMEIQGENQFSALAGSLVETSGVVTQRRRNGAGFWIQDPRGDGNAATSDGIYVDLSNAAAGVGLPAVGDRVRVAALVEEEQNRRALPHTRLTQCSAVEVLASGEDLPGPVLVSDLPNVDLEEAIAFWEPLEGMRIRLENAVIVGPTEENGEFAVLTRADAVPGSGYFPENHHVLLRSLDANEVDYNPEIIVIQTTAKLAPRVRPGDEIVELVGVVDYYDGIYKVWPDTYRVTTREIPEPPLSKRSGPMGNVRVVSYNMRDLFDDMDTPVHLDERYTPDTATLDIRLDKLALSFIHELKLPHIIVTNEVESAGIQQMIADRVNPAAGTRYRVASLDTSDWRGLEVSFIYDENRVDLLDYYQMSGPAVVEAFGEGIFRTREPLVGIFRFSEGGPELMVLANKFKTKRGDDPRLSVNEKPFRETESQRKVQARTVRDFLNSVLAENPDALIMVTGDLGDFQFAEPEEGEDHPIGIIAGMGEEARFVNLLEQEDPAEAFTYVFQGNSMAVTHMLVSPALYKLYVGADVLHFNAGFPDELRHDRSHPIRASDRDPLEGRFEFPME